jgi:hypothetical protein
MPTFTTQITDANVIAELPDVSILAALYDDALTLSEVEAAMSSVSFRKKLQSILEFKLSDASKDSMYAALKTSYIAYEQGQGSTVVESGGNVFVNDRLVAFSVDGFASGVFEDTTFADMFFTESVMDVIFTSGDESFITALISVPNFWDKLLAKDTVTQHVEDTYGDIISDATKNVECAYTKYVTFKAGLDFNKYKDILYLAEDSPAMDTIVTVPEAKAIESASKFGMQARLMYVFNTTDMDAIANSQDNIDRLASDASLRNVVVDFDSISVLPIGSLMRNFVINNDGYFGAITSERLGLETTISMSNLFYDNTYSDERELFAQDYDLVTLLFESNLYQNFKQQFYDAFTALNVADQKFSFKVNSSTGTLTGHYTTHEFDAKKLALSLSSFSETKAAAISNVTTAEKVFFTPYTFIDESIIAVQIDHGVEFTNPDNYNLYDEFSTGKFNTVLGANGHLVGIMNDGKVISSKFVIDLNLSTETVEKIDTCENSVFIKTQETFHAYGNLGADKAAIVNNLIINKDDLVNAVEFSGSVLALGTDGEVKIVDGNGISAYSAASGITVVEMWLIDGRLVVLDNAGLLKEIKADSTVVDIAANVTNITYGQDALVLRVSGQERAVFNYGGQWLVYDFNVNAL